MIANFFKKTKPIHAIFICVLFLLFYLVSIFLVEKPDFSFLLVLKKTGFLLFFLVLFFLIRFINRKNQLSGQDSYVLLVLVLLFGMFPRTMIVNKIVIAHFFLLFSFRRVYSIRSFKNVKQKVFDSAFWIGIASLFYMWSAVFLLIILVAVFVYKKQEIRNSIIAIVGFITPLFLVFTYCFMIDNSSAFFVKLFFEYSLSLANFNSLQYLVPICFIGVFTIISIVIVRLKINSLANDLKPSYILLTSHFLIAIYIILLSPEKNGSEFVFMFFPIAILSANMLQLIKHKILREVVVYSFFLVALGVYFL